MQNKNRTPEPHQRAGQLSARQLVPQLQAISLDEIHFTGRRLRNKQEQPVGLGPAALWHAVFQEGVSQRSWSNLLDFQFVVLFLVVIFIFIIVNFRRDDVVPVLFVVDVLVFVLNVIFDVAG